MLCSAKDKHRSFDEIKPRVLGGLQRIIDFGRAEILPIGVDELNSRIGQLQALAKIPEECLLAQASAYERLPGATHTAFETQPTF